MKYPFLIMALNFKRTTVKLRYTQVKRMRMVRLYAATPLPMSTVVNMLYLYNKAFGKRKHQNSKLINSPLKTTNCQVDTFIYFHAVSFAWQNNQFYHDLSPS